MQIITLTYKKKGEPQNRLIVVYRCGDDDGGFDTLTVVR